MREAREEAGLEIQRREIVHLCDAPHDFGEGTVHAFAVTIQGAARLSINEAEIAEMRWLTLADALNLPMFPAMRSVLRSLALRTDLLYSQGP